MNKKKDARNIRIRKKPGWGLFLVAGNDRSQIDRIGDHIVSLYKKKDRAEHEVRAFAFLSVDNASVGEKAPLIQRLYSMEKEYIALKNQIGRIVAMREGGWGLADLEAFCPSVQKKMIGSYKIDIDTYYGIEINVYRERRQAEEKRSEIIHAWHNHQKKKVINYGHINLKEARKIFFRGKENYCSIPSDAIPKFEVGDIAVYTPMKIQLKPGCKRKTEKVFLEPQFIEILDGPKQDWDFPTKHAKSETTNDFFYLGGHSHSKGILYFVEMEIVGKKKKVWRNQDMFEKVEVEEEGIF